MKSLRFGTAGIPVQTKGDTIQGIQDVNKLGLNAMELEFVHSVNIKEEKAKEVKKTAQKEHIVLTCHGQYYINLNAKEKEKREASKKRVITAATRLHQCGGYSCTFHAGFYLKQDPEKVYETIKQQMKEIKKTLDNNNIDVWIRPETTGKPTQWGHFREILKLSQELEKVMPCIDFAHVHARENGKWNSKEEFNTILEEVETALGKEGLNNMHCHCTGIAYGEKGEKHHLNLKESDMKYKELCQTWKEFKVRGVVISESPNIEKDALLLQKTYQNI